MLLEAKGQMVGEGSLCCLPGSWGAEDASEVAPLGQLSVRLDTYTPVSALCHR